MPTPEIETEEEAEASVKPSEEPVETPPGDAEPEVTPEPSPREHEALRRLLAGTVARCADALADPSDVLAFCDENALLDDEGWPSEARIRVAAEQLAAERPYLAARRFADVGQGARNTSEPRTSLGEMLRRAAG